MPTEPQIKSECDARYTSIWQWFSGSVTLIIILVGIFSTMAYRASDAATEVKKDAATLQTSMTFVLQGIDRVEASQIRLEAKVDGMNGGGE